MPDGAETAGVAGVEKLQVGEWTVEPALNQLSAAGRSAKLEPKAMALLCYLADRPGQVVSREGLLSAVWPGVVVGDDSLTQAMIKLRKALGDTADAPNYIQTIPKGGYRLVAPVVTSAQAATAVFEASPGVADRKRRPTISWVVAASLAAAIAGAVGLWWAFGERGIPDKVVTVDTEATRAAQPAVQIKPFEALGDDPQARLLARGVTADLVTDLSKVFGLSIITDVPSGGRAGEEAAAQGFPARYLVSGSVQRIEDRLRLQVHLTDALTGKQLWSERFERTAASLFALQDELVPKLLQTLPAKVSEAELRRVAQHHTRSLEAYEYYQRGQMALLVRRQEENELARDMFGRAIALDASFALAYAALAHTYVLDHRNQWTGNRAASLERAFELARTAHEINPDVRETYWVLALVHLERGEHGKALDYLETALKLYPSFADAYALMGGIHAYSGQPASTLPLLRTAMRLNREGGYLYFLILGRAYFALGDIEQARINLRHALQRNPVNLEARVYMAAALAAAGEKSDAAWEAEEIRALQPGFAHRTWLSTHPLTDVKVRARLAQALAALGR